MDIGHLLEKMTLEEKAGMCSGEDHWHLKAVPRLGIPPAMMADGPHGLRKQEEASDHLGVRDSKPAVCFPSGAGMAASFNRDLLYRLGETLGEACRAEGISVLLGPAVNIKRSPLCGRNFEYLSEDPYLSGELATAYVNGLQSKNVGASLKHYAANNQETRRMSVSAEIDERTLREIYLAAFESVVKQAKPWTVMCSYNRLNGEYVSQSKRLLTDILRDEWGFEGYVVTDWGACNDRVAGLRAGQDLEMPGSGGVNDREIVKAVRAGTLDESVLDSAVERILHVHDKAWRDDAGAVAYSLESHHQAACQLALETMVLLKNDGILPLKKGSNVVFIGGFAKHPRYQGGGSSHVHPYKVVGALDAASGLAEIRYCEGYSLDDDSADELLIAQAVQAACQADAAVVFAGLPDHYESEGYDRGHLDMPESHNRLIEAVAAAQPKTVVVLHNGGPVVMPWIENVGAVLECYLGGEAVGQAQAALLFGDANPCGKLAETFPLRLEDTPAFLNFPGEKDFLRDRVEYREGLFVGYRHYDALARPVLFPFGHGLSYTSFEYGNLVLDKNRLHDGDVLTVRCRVKNTGNQAGKEVVQLYVQNHTAFRPHPVKSLKGFCKVELQPAAETEVEFTLDKRAFAHYDEIGKNWCADRGRYSVLVGSSSTDIRLEAELTYEPPDHRWVIGPETLLGDILAHPVTAPVLKTLISRIGIDIDAMLSSPVESPGGVRAAYLLNLPLYGTRNHTGGRIDNEMIDSMIHALNSALVEQKAPQTEERVLLQ